METILLLLLLILFIVPIYIFIGAAIVRLLTRWNILKEGKLEDIPLLLMFWIIVVPILLIAKSCVTIFNKFKKNKL